MSADDFSARRYIASLSAVRPETRRYYENVLRPYLEWLESESIDVVDVVEGDIVRYLDSQRRRLKPGSIYGIFKIVRAYHRWLASIGAISESPAANLKANAMESNPAVRMMTVEDLRAMLDAAGSDRNWALVAMLAISSLRVSDLLACGAADLSHDGTHHLLHVKSLYSPRRLQYVILPDEVEVVLRRQLNGRTNGPLFLTKGGSPLLRSDARTAIQVIARRAGLQYPVSPQVLAYALPSIAIQRGFSFRSVIRAAGIPERKLAEKWLGPVSLSNDDNASIRLARLLFNDPDSAETYLMHIEAVLHESDLPDAIVVMTAGAILEKHLYELCLAHQLPVPEDRRDGKISTYVHHLYKNKVITQGDLRLTERLAYDRNNAAHGAFDLLEPDSGAYMLRNVRRLVAKHPLPASEA